MNKKTLFIGTALMLILAFTAAMTLFQNQQPAKNNALTTQQLSALERGGAPIKGPRYAKVTIVEFFDPACKTCAKFHSYMNDLVKKYPGKVKVEMRYAPLHQGSDQVVKLLEAAHLQGQFWPALELLFANQNAWTSNHVSQPSQAQNILAQLPLKSEQFITDFNSKDVENAVTQDIKDGQILNVRATPEFFVNGKPMPSFGYEQLTQLVEQAIAEVY